MPISTLGSVSHNGIRFGSQSSSCGASSAQAILHHDSLYATRAGNRYRVAAKGVDPTVCILRRKDARRAGWLAQSACSGTDMVDTMLSLLLLALLAMFFKYCNFVGTYYVAFAVRHWKARKLTRAFLGTQQWATLAWMCV